MNKNRKIFWGLAVGLVVFVILCAVAVVILNSAERHKSKNQRVISGAKMIDSENLKANSLMLDIWEAIDQKDSDAIKGLLSQNAREEIVDVDGKIDTFLNFFKGDIVKCTTLLPTSKKSISDRKVKSEIWGDYIIETTEESYRLVFIYVVRDDNSVEQEGIHRIDVVTEEYERGTNDWGGKQPDICVYGR